MQYLLFLAAILFFTSCTNADTNADGSSMDSLQAARRDSLANLTQTTSTDLNTSVQSFMYYNKILQFDSMANYIYPAVYKHIPKSQVIQGLGILEVLDGIEVRMDSANVLRMDTITRFSSGEAARMDYVLKLSLVIQDTGVGKQVTPQARNMFIGALKSSLGTENVTYNDTTQTIGAIIQRQALAINDTISKGWKFIPLENNAHLRQIIPAEIGDRFLNNPQPIAGDTLRRNDTVGTIRNN
jgi:hypothetical protein